MCLNKTVSTNWELEVALQECGYISPMKITEEIGQIRVKYKDLQINVEYYGSLERNLINFTVPVSTSFNGHFYEILVCVWLHHTYPFKPPKCYLKKTVNIELMPGEIYPPDGYMDLKCVKEWTWGNSHLLVVIEELEKLLKNKIYSRFPEIFWDKGSSQTDGSPNLVNNLTVRNDPVFPRREVVKPNASATWQKPALDANKTNSPCPDIDDAFQSLSLENIVREYNLGTSLGTSEIKRDSWEVDDVYEAVVSCPDYTSALQYLSHNCQICCNEFSFSKFVTMTHCNCSLCEKCFVTYFSSVIKEKNITFVVCPLCKKPDLEKEGNTEETMEFFNLLDTQIRHYLDQSTHELFQRKLRDRTLMQMPNFRWCSHCSFGLLHEAARLRMDCPSCSKSTCFNCKEPWKEQHERISCEDFRIWKLQNQPNHQEERLNAYLTKNGIECPSCKFRFDLSKGGCLHFKCTQCYCEFCGGCRRPFKQGSDCHFSRDCHGKGLHAHHSRSCFYYLRDWDMERLHHFLAENGLYCRRKVPGDLKESFNSINSFESNRNQLLENDVGEADYKELLVQIINSKSLDPADVYTEKEMILELQRWNVPVPEKDATETRELYLQRLKMKIKTLIPLDVDHGYYK
ncbi:E3 ubiquitin-protein ligase RNF31-like [Discoglossus pictus]